MPSIRRSPTVEAFLATEAQGPITNTVPFALRPDHRASDMVSVPTVIHRHCPDDRVAFHVPAICLACVLAIIFCQAGSSHPFRGDPKRAATTWSLALTPPTIFVVLAPETIDELFHVWVCVPFA